MLEKELLNNIKRILRSAKLIYEDKDYTSSTILYFKAIFGILDYILLLKEGKTPKDHTERFRMLEKTYPDIYEFIDKYFKIYRDTYSTSVDKETCDKLRKNTNEIINKYKINLRD
jgi:uncharacterized protein (UPF0332 family)